MPLPRKPTPRGLPAPRSKKVDVTEKGSKVREVEVPIHDPEVQDGDMVNAMKSQMTKVPPAGYQTVGLSLGATLNLGDYESARIDVFIIRNVSDAPGVADKEFQKISQQLNTELVRQADIIKGESEPAPARKQRR